VTNPETVLTEDMVEQLIRQVLAGTLSRTAACSFVTPWAEGLLPATRLAESGAQTIHGLDVVRDRLGHHIHPRGGDAGLDFIVDEAELIRRCERWLAVAGRDTGHLP